MKQLGQDKQQQNPGVITTLSRGFDETTRHIWIILLPLLVDIFYWLGPRLSIEKLFIDFVDTFPSESAFAELTDQMLQVSAQFNLFTSLSVPIIGIPALMGGTVPEKTPLLPTVIQIEDPGVWLGLFALFTVSGLLLTSIYFRMIGYIVRGVNSEPGSINGSSVIQLFQTFLRLIGLAIIFIISTIVVWIPLIPLALLAGLLGVNVFYVVMMVGLVIVATYLSLSVPAIVFANKTLVRAIRESISIAHRNLVPLLGLLLVVVIVTSGTKLLWHMADNGSWLTLISLAGNAFISTAMIMAVFIFYRDRQSYLTEVQNNTR